MESDFTAVWTAQAEPGASDEVGSSMTTTEVAPQATGPVSTAIEGSQWTREDIELAVSVLNGIVLMLTLYAVVTDRGAFQ